MRIIEVMPVADPSNTLTSAFFGSRWNPDINCYENVRAVTFQSDRDLERGIDCFWRDPALKGAPRIHAGDLTVFMPMEAVSILLHAGIQLTHSELVNDDEPVINNSHRKHAALSF